MASMGAVFRTLQNSENPTLNFSLFAVVRFKARVEIPFETAARVRTPQPFGRRKGVLLVRCSPCTWEGSVTQRRIDLRNHGAIRPHAPTVERPEMHVVLSLLPDVAQSWNSYVDPCTSIWNADLAVRARSSVTRRHRGLPEQAAPFPVMPSRTKST